MKNPRTASSSSAAADAVPPWLDLPREVTASILRRLGAVEILMSAEKVCKSWRDVCRDPAMWRSIHMRNTGEPSETEKMCCHAVDRSQGQLTDLKLEYFGTDNLLRFISHRCNQLRSLQLVHSVGVTNDGLIEAAKTLASLEDLHLYRMYDLNINAETIKSIGRLCPQLKKFKFDHIFYKRPQVTCNAEALAIAEAMPGLQHLQLLGNNLTNEGVQAILNGCPHLESLDLRQCFNVHLDGSLGRLCSQRIKDLRFPRDSMDDYEFYVEVLGYSTSDDDDDSINGFSDVDMVSDVDEDAEFSEGSSSDSSSSSSSESDD